MAQKSVSSFHYLWQCQKIFCQISDTAFLESNSGIHIAVIFCTWSCFFRIKCTFVQEMLVISSDSLRVYLASLFRSSLIFASHLWLIFKLLPPITELLCPSRNCPVPSYIITINIHNFIINSFSTLSKFCVILNGSPNFYKVSLAIIIHILTKWSTSTPFQNKIALP